MGELLSTPAGVLALWLAVVCTVICLLLAYPLAVILRIRSIACLILLTGRVISRIHGIPAILMPCGRICWKGVRRC